MRPLAAVLLVGCATTHTAFSVVMEPELTYPLRPELHECAGWVRVDGDVPQAIDIPYVRGLTARLGMLMAGRATPTEAGALLQRSENGELHQYRIPMRLVFDGKLPDPELAPGDHLLVDFDFKDVCANDC